MHGITARAARLKEKKREYLIPENLASRKIGESEMQGVVLFAHGQAASFVVFRQETVMP